MLSVHHKPIRIAGSIVHFDFRDIIALQHSEPQSAHPVMTEEQMIEDLPLGIVPGIHYCLTHSVEVSSEAAV